MVNKPVIQWVVEEAVDAGITDIAIITGKHKQAIENHFRPSPELEDALEKAGKLTGLEEIRKVNEIANIAFIIQEEQKGLGHAILCAEEFVGDSSFAVLLGDTICVGEPNCTKGLVEIFEQKKSSIFAVGKIKLEETKRYGVVSGKEISEGLMLVDKLVEKPEPEVTPSLLGILRRYVFTPDFFNFQRTTNAGDGGEIQLTDAMQALATESRIYSWTFGGRRYDIGTMKDWFQSHLELSANSEFSPILNEIVNKL